MPAKPSTIGQVFGLLTVVEVEPKRSPTQKTPRWKCRCACGVECVKWSSDLRRTDRLGPGGEVVPVSCGCRLVPPNIIGQRFGKLTVQSIDPGTGEGRIAACLCDCGQTTHLLVHSLSGKNRVRSCGCLANLKGPTRGLGSRPARAGKSYKPIAPKKVAKVLALYAAGIGVEEIMRRTGVSQTSVYYLRVRAGIPPKREVGREEREAARKAEAAAKAARRAARDVTGKKFHKLLVLRMDSHRLPSGAKEVLVVCRCDCGREVTAAKPGVVLGRTKSCGCLTSGGKLRGVGSRKAA